MSSEKGSLSGLTEGEAREFHSIFVTSFIVFTLIAVVAHFLVWQCAPGSDTTRLARYRSNDRLRRAKDVSHMALV